jgi:hypothetical protein
MDGNWEVVHYQQWLDRLRNDQGQDDLHMAGEDGSMEELLEFFESADIRE